MSFLSLPVLAGILMAHDISSQATMIDAARHFLAALSAEQRAKASIAFSDEERMNWHYIPRARRGLPLKEMTPEQKHLAAALLSAGLSQRGYIKASTIMSLEDILRTMEQDTTGRRDPEKYYFSIFGEPAENKIWGYRVEGHHVSLNFVVSGNRVATSPTFFGANPAEVRQGPRSGLRVLAREEDLARALVLALSSEQRADAIVSKTAYSDILTQASRKAALKGQPSGLQASRMDAHQRAMLGDLLDEYVHNLPNDLAEYRSKQIRDAGTNLWFAWAGGTAKGEPHYYRIQATAFLVEYDDTQDGANHIHSVWRDFNGDFGEDLLEKHYATADREHGHTHR